MSEVLSGSDLSIPRDESQALRMRRYLMAAGTSLLLCVTLFIFALVERLPWRVAIEGTAGGVVLVPIFYVLFRPRPHLRFSAPSLTTDQLGAAALFLAHLLTPARPARSAPMLF